MDASATAGCASAIERFRTTLDIALRTRRDIRRFAVVAVILSNAVLFRFDGCHPLPVPSPGITGSAGGQGLGQSLVAVAVVRLLMVLRFR
jgi:hypothetical protein